MDRKYIQSVKPLTDHVLQVDFISGSRLLLDMKPYLDKFRFRSLSDPQVWNSAVTNGIFVRFGDVEMSHNELFSMAEQEQCIGCGACVAACKNGSAMLFVSAKVSQLALLPQGKVEAARRAKAMLSKMDELGFGNCTNTRACEAECPKLVSISNIARLNREFIAAKLKD